MGFEILNLIYKLLTKFVSKMEKLESHILVMLLGAKVYKLTGI